MKKIRKNDFRKSPDRMKRLGSMEKLIMPSMSGLTDSGFSVELTDEEMMEAIGIIQEFEEGKNEKDN